MRSETFFCPESGKICEIGPLAALLSYSLYDIVQKVELTISNTWKHLGNGKGNNKNL